MRVIEHADMSKYTSFKAGGTTEKLVIVDTPTELMEVIGELKKTARKYIFLGNGTNTLFLDGEYDGVVIKAGEEFESIEISPCNLGDSSLSEFFKITAGSAVLLSKVAKVAAAEGLTGLEFAAGIPGSVGGGVFMNAGAYDGEIKNVLSSVTVITEDDGELKIKEISADELELDYRHSKIMETGDIIISATFFLSKGNKRNIEEKMRDFSDRRSSKQPLEYPSAGSFFKRPPGDFAGRLIEASGLAGFTVGGAKVSEKHCGFIINTGNATATDIVKLMKEVQNKVCDKFGVRLEPEVRLIGEFNGEEEREETDRKD